jgi:intracellular septation protein
MRSALMQLLSDFLSAIVFLVLYLLTDSVTLATAVAIAVGLAQFAYLKSLARPIDAMQWLALVLVLGLGAATLISQDSRFIMLKPSLVHWAVAAVMLRPGWMIRYLPPVARDNIGRPVLVASGYAWAGLMLLLGVANVIVALTMSFQAWAWFITFVAGGSKLIGFVAQYWIFRAMIAARLRAQPPLNSLKAS